MQPAVTEALSRALFVEWARSGYGALSLEAVARRAGVGKAALYRRWPSKMVFVVDRLEKVGVELAVIPDTGALRSDVLAMVKAIDRLLRRWLVRRILPDLHAQMLRSPDLAASIRGKLQVERRARASLILERAVARGEVSPEVDVELAADAMGALVYWRVIVTANRRDAAYFERLTNFIVAGILATGCAPGS